MTEIKSAGECLYDEISLGEIMLRLDPGDGRIRNARSFSAWEGGGEYNVAKALHSCFGLKTAVVTAFAKNEVGELLKSLVMQGGVDTSLIKWVPFDGTGKTSRNGINFTERGFGVRGACGVSDRGNTAASQIAPTDFDFDYIFGELGVRWLHTGGIFAALSPSCARTTLAAVKAARKYGTIVSYDINYRPSLWDSAGGVEAARELNREIARYVNVIIGNTWHFTSCLCSGANAKNGEPSDDDCRKAMKAVLKEFPEIEIAAMTRRKVHSANVNDWSALCLANGKLYESAQYKNLGVFDRVGGGDGFASGIIYGLMEKNDVQYAVDCGAAHGALVMTTPGDTSMAQKSEVEALMRGLSGDVTR